MSQTIPFNHPSLVLGNIIDTQLLNVLQKISSIQGSSEIAREKMNSLLMMKRSLAMTLNELMDMSIDVSDLEKQILDIDTNIKTAARSYLTSKIKSEAEVQKLKESLLELEVGTTTASPLDFTQSKILNKPLATESLKLDAQFFSFDINLQRDTLAGIETFIKESNSDLGSKANEIAQKATSQIEQQHQQHNVAGTLIISACCTHKNVSIIEPLVLDPNRALDSWNQHFPNDGIDMENPKTQKSSAGSTMDIITGASYGSSFVGMVHILNSQESNDNVTDQMIDSLNKKMKLGGWLAENTGGLGVPEEIIKEVKTAIDSRKVNSHITLLTMGTFTSISSKSLKMGLDTLTQPNQSSETLSEDDSSNETVGSDAKESVRKKQSLEVKNVRNRTILNELKKSDAQQNQVMDINSLMSAFEDFLRNIKNPEGVVGVPIQFFIKKIKKQRILELLQNKFSTESIKKTNPDEKES